MKKADFENIDLEKIILKAWSSISPCSKKSFFYMFAIINIVFLWHTVTFFFGNHDWEHIKTYINIGWSLFDGRWGAGLLQQYAGGDILPVLNNLFCFSGFCFAMVALAKYWKIPKTVFTYTVFGLFIMLMPYTHPWLQFIRSETHFWNILIIILGLEMASSKKICWQLSSIFVFIFSVGCYGAIMGGIISIYLCRCLLDAWFEYKNFKAYVKDHYLPVVYMAISFVLAIIIEVVLKTKYVEFIKFYSTEVAGIEDIWKNILTLPEALKATFFAPLPFLPTFFKCFLLTGFPLCLILLCRKSLKECMLICLIIVALVISTQLLQIVSEATLYNHLRLDFFWMPYIYAVFWAILLRQKKVFWKSLALLMMVIATYYSALQSFRCQKVKYLDNQAEMKIFDDIISRIKVNPNFSPDKQYYLYMIGEYNVSAYDHYNETPHWHDNWLPFVPTWQGKDFLNFYEKKPYIIDAYNRVCNLLITEDVLMTMDIDYLLTRAAPWPDKNSVHVEGDYIYIIISQYELDWVRKTIISNLKAHVIEEKE